MNAKVRIQVCNTLVSWGIGPIGKAGNQAEFAAVAGSGADIVLHDPAGREKSASLPALAAG